MNFENRYGRLDRLLHRIAFRSGMAQQAMSDVEDMLYRRTLESVQVESPVLVTGLPRSGTTILLTVLVDTGRFASHTYQDMPFVMCPMLWNRFSRHFRVDDTPRERAHGDGLLISGKSPEAFEEMIWKYFWPGHYRDDRIEPWTSSEANQEFDEFLEGHMRKIIALRGDGESANRRYLSKNNMNIARLAAVPKPFRGGTFLVPFREPIQHAASMLKQHERFLRIHEEDDFVRRYMEAIGHHDFGKGLKPVDFGGWITGEADVKNLEFWVRYWIAAYRHVLDHAGASVHLISYRRLTTEPASFLPWLAEVAHIPSELLMSQAERVHPPRQHAIEGGEVGPASRREASELYELLEAKASSV